MKLTTGFTAAIVAAAFLAQVAAAQDRPTVAYIAPSLDIDYWQWVARGVEQKAGELGMDYVE